MSMLIRRVQELEQRADALIVEATSQAQSLHLESGSRLKAELVRLEEEFAARLAQLRAEGESAHAAALQALETERTALLKQLDGLGEAQLDALADFVARSLAGGGSDGD